MEKWTPWGLVPVPVCLPQEEWTAESSSGRSYLVLYTCIIIHSFSRIQRSVMRCKRSEAFVSFQSFCPSQQPLFIFLQLALVVHCWFKAAADIIDTSAIYFESFREQEDLITAASNRNTTHRRVGLKESVWQANDLKFSSWDLQLFQRGNWPKCALCHFSFTRFNETTGEFLFPPETKM